MMVWIGIVGCLQATSTTEKVVASAETGEITEDDLSWVDPISLPAGSNPCREPTRVKVNYVADGDTIFVSDGAEKVRIIGIDTPELGDDECFAQEAKDFLSDLIQDRWIWLTFDRDCLDVYDRTLAYVHLGPSEMDFVERQLLRGGYAQDFPFDNTDTFADLFAADEATARADNIGGWSVCSW